MNYKPITILLLTALSVALSSTAVANRTWYVNGITGSNTNNCMTVATACKTIRHAISLAAAGDSILVTPSTYREPDRRLSAKLRPLLLMQGV